ncbi:hypothetical protein EDEG_02282 [Edhazardia aedis USNM 41457]|uniref:BHLH domain-containing protein n=1 Tax=Edhazardia aedis (strain USNM 41457) TaxID=1003232 RepID=J9DPS6_EDHAE|nr:hypothetical protein EDEG_02282 [Edhazardia aedis USNM 41457]|eukprot:EJW03372.1 hypothetical protein EDEG_02282 [Edhazardia aedis USNM 41457]
MKKMNSKNNQQADDLNSVVVEQKCCKKRHDQPFRNQMHKDVKNSCEKGNTGLHANSSSILFHNNIIILGNDDVNPKNQRLNNSNDMNPVVDNKLKITNFLNYNNSFDVNNGINKINNDSNEMDNYSFSTDNFKKNDSVNRNLTNNLPSVIKKNKDSNNNIGNKENTTNTETNLKNNLADINKNTNIKIGKLNSETVRLNECDSPEESNVEKNKKLGTKFCSTKLFDKDVYTIKHQFDRLNEFQNQVSTVIQPETQTSNRFLENSSADNIGELASSSTEDPSKKVYMECVKVEYQPNSSGKEFSKTKKFTNNRCLREFSLDSGIKYNYRKDKNIDCDEINQSVVFKNYDDDRSRLDSPRATKNLKHENCKSFGRDGKQEFNDTNSSMRYTRDKNCYFGFKNTFNGEENKNFIHFNDKTIEKFDDNSIKKYSRDDSLHRENLKHFSGNHLQKNNFIERDYIDMKEKYLYNENRNGDRYMTRESKFDTINNSSFDKHLNKNYCYNGANNEKEYYCKNTNDAFLNNNYLFKNKYFCKEYSDRKYSYKNNNFSKNVPDNKYFYNINNTPREAFSKNNDKNFNSNKSSISYFNNHKLNLTNAEFDAATALLALSRDKSINKPIISNFRQNITQITNSKKSYRQKIRPPSVFANNLPDLSIEENLTDPKRRYILIISNINSVYTRIIAKNSKMLSLQQNHAIKKVLHSLQILANSVEKVYTKKYESDCDQDTNLEKNMCNEEDNDFEPLLSKTSKLEKIRRRAIGAGFKCLMQMNPYCLIKSQKIATFESLKYLLMLKLENAQLKEKKYGSRNVFKPYSCNDKKSKSDSKKDMNM